MPVQPKSYSASSEFQPQTTTQQMRSAFSLGLRVEEMRGARRTAKSAHRRRQTAAEPNAESLAAAGVLSSGKSFDVSHSVSQEFQRRVEPSDFLEFSKVN